jgi:hypothetical protein
MFTETLKDVGGIGVMLRKKLLANIKYIIKKSSFA